MMVTEMVLNPGAVTAARHPGSLHSNHNPVQVKNLRSKAVLTSRGLFQSTAPLLSFCIDQVLRSVGPSPYDHPHYEKDG